MSTLPDLPALAWITLALISSGVIVAMVRTLSTFAAGEMESHDLAVEVRNLQLEYKRRLLDDNGGHTGTADDPIVAIPIEDLEDDVTLV